MTTQKEAQSKLTAKKPCDYQVIKNRHKSCAGTAHVGYKNLQIKEDSK